jgi:hypothetical protein
MPIHFTNLAQQTFSSDFKSKIIRVYNFFPELHDKKIICGSIKKRGRIEGIATSWTFPPIFRLRPNVSNYIIAHELTHLTQGNGFGIPHGEVACDIWTVNRMPVEMLDQRPYYLLKRCRGIDWKHDRIIIKEICKQAIEIRKIQRSYIVWLLNQIKSIG